jgi:autotransporter-associated beta strand protein
MLTIQDGSSFSSNNVIGGTGGIGAGLGTAGGTGVALGKDIFLMSGGNLSFNLSGTVTIPNPIQSDSGAGGGTGGGLVMQGTGTLALPAANTYTGSTLLTSGTIQIVDDTSLGNSANTTSLGTGTLRMTGNLTSSRTFGLQGAATIDTQGNQATFSGVLSGAGSVTLIGSGGSVTFSGANTYTGGATIGSGLALYGNTSSIIGNIVFAASSSTVTFTQLASATYSGTFTGAGSANLQGPYTLEFTGTSSSFTGNVNVAAGMTFNMNGFFAASSSTTIANGATISGGGTVGNLISDGVISPGNSIGTLTVGGTLGLGADSILEIEIAPGGSSDLIAVASTATLGGTVNIIANSGFYGFGDTFLFLTSAGLVGPDRFAGFTLSLPDATGSLSYPATQNAEFTLTIIRPFADFPFSNQNTRAVGENLDALNVAGELNPAFVDIINSWVGLSFGAINSYLDQMHPAPYSALLDIQAQAGGQLLSLFHRTPSLFCCSSHKTRLWAEPMGNWLKQGNLGEQVGFYAYTKGIAFGLDFELGDSVVFGIGGAFNETDIQWRRSIGTGMRQQSLGGMYLDWNYSDFYFGWNVLAGIDDHEIRRHIAFPTLDARAHGDFSSLDLMSQFSFAYFFGTPVCLLYPYANFDVFYLQSSEIHETNADALDLNVAFHRAATVRGEAGMKLQIKDSNYNETICFSPSFGIGWAMECPIYRPVYTAKFAGEPISFEAHGWNQTWQLFSLSFGLKVTVKSVTLSGEYISEITPEGRDQFWGQRANFGLELIW